MDWECFAIPKRTVWISAKTTMEDATIIAKKIQKINYATSYFSGVKNENKSR